MRIAYLINQYPAVSHTFIRREIRALEKQGHDVLRISIRGSQNAKADQDLIEQEKTRYVLQGGAPPLILAFLRALYSRPRSLAKAAALMWRTSRNAERSFAIHL